MGWTILLKKCFWSPGENAMTDEAKRVELHRLTEDRAEAADVAKDHPDIVARLSKLALDWKAALPAKPNPVCITTASVTERPAARKPASKGVTPEVGAMAFARWDTENDGLLALDEYKAGLRGQEKLEARFKNFDKDGDGELTRDEFIGRKANQLLR